MSRTLSLSDGAQTVFMTVYDQGTAQIKDISAATELTAHLIRPDKSTTTVSAAFTDDGSDGEVTVQLAGAVRDTDRGWWNIYLTFSLSGSDRQSSTESFLMTE